MTREEIKIRQLSNQYLITPGEKMTVVRDLCGLQAQFMVNAMHSMKIRCQDYEEATAGSGLVKNWTLRGTVHVFAEEDLSLFLHSNNATDYRRDEWKGYVTWQKPDGAYTYVNDGTCKRVWSLTPERQKYFSNVILKAVKQAPKTRDELKEICRQAGMNLQEEDSMFDQWGGGIREMCERGFMNYIVQEKKAFTEAPYFTPIPEKEAKLEIARRYFTNIAPATIHDAMYFLGAKSSEVKEWLSQLPVKSVPCEGKTYYYIENGRTSNEEIPACIFLAGFDQLMLGYQKKESLYLPQEHLRGIFNLAGIVMPAILLQGKVVGKWKKKNTKVALTLFENIGDTEKKIITDTVEKTWTNVEKIVMNE